MGAHQAPLTRGGRTRARTAWGCPCGHAGKQGSNDWTSVTTCIATVCNPDLGCAQSKLAALAGLREHLLQLLQQVARVQPAPASALPESSLEQRSPGRFQLWPPTAGPSASKLHLGCQP
ncbi:hypothetical protein HaLaN_08147, partial [Haematococcus lacustris]